MARTLKPILPGFLRSNYALYALTATRSAALSLSETSSDWRVAANRAMLLSDVGLLQTDLVGACSGKPLNQRN